MSDAFAMDANNKPLTYKAARHAHDSALWRIEESKELIQCKIKVKVLVRRIRGTYGGNISDYSGNCSSCTADLQTVKLH